MKEKKADIIAVGRAAGVSISTVSRAFNHPDLVKPATRKKIDRAVRKLGYIRNRAAQTMHGIRSGTIGVVVPTIDHTIFAEVIQAFSDAVDEHGFTILLASHGYDLEREYGILRKFLEHRVDGVAMVGLDHSEETYQLLDRQRIPALSLWNYDATSRIGCVGADNRAAGAMAAQHLLDLGHRRIATVFAPTDDNDRARDRLSGATEALSAAGCKVPVQWALQSAYSTTQAKEIVASLLAPADRPSAILCGNDVLALGAVYAASRAGVPVPDALTIVGIGDFKGSKDTEPALTTVRLPARQIGRRAGEELARAIINPGGDIVRLNSQPDLLVRQTSAPVGV